MHDPTGTEPRRTEQRRGALLAAHAGDAILFEGGTFHLASQLNLSTNEITLRGCSEDRTVFDFSAQTAGASAVELTGENDKVESLKSIDTRATPCARPR